MAALKQAIYIVGAKRTPFGTFGGKLKKLTPTQLGVIAGKAALQASGVSAKHVGSVIFGNCIHSAKDTAYLTRHILLQMQLPVTVPGMTVNRLCGSGFQSVLSVAQDLAFDECDVGIAGGTESMSLAPFVVRNVRFGTQLGVNYEFEDMLWQSLTDQQANTSMGMTAELLGAKYNVTREDCDEIALRSQTRWALSNRAGYFQSEIAPVSLKSKKGGQEELFTTDEHPRSTSADSLAKLRPVFKPDGLVTAGNASGMGDGAAAVVLATEAAVNKHRLSPLVRLVGWHVVGCEPTLMGIGPAPAIRTLLDKVSLKLDQVELIEVNEAFAAQYAAVEKDLGLNPDITNVNGGAIAIGHPLGASGARITVHLTHEMIRRKVKYAVGSACIGGGQGIAILLENVCL